MVFVFWSSSPTFDGISLSNLWNYFSFLETTIVFLLLYFVDIFKDNITGGENFFFISLEVCLIYKETTKFSYLTWWLEILFNNANKTFINKIFCFREMKSKVMSISNQNDFVLSIFCHLFDKHCCFAGLGKKIVPFSVFNNVLFWKDRYHHFWKDRYHRPL